LTPPVSLDQEISRMKAHPTRPLFGLFFALLGWAQAANPVRAETHGGIEIGAKGVKATVLDVTDGDGGYGVKVLLSATKNTKLTEGLKSSGRFDDAALRDAAGAVAQFAAQMDKDHRVPPERLHVVGSSGLFSAIEKKPDAVRMNQDLLAAAVRDACGLKVTFIDVKREVELSVVGTIPPKDGGRAILLDIGGGNTKGGYCDGDKDCVSFGIPYGSVTFTDRVKDHAGKEGFAASAEALRTEVLVPELKKAVEGKPELTRRPRIYLSGGACWALATLVHPGDRSAYVVLTANDVDTYRQMLVAAKGEFPTPDLSRIIDPEVREAARKEIEQVKGVFKPEQLLAGAAILKALSDEFGFAGDKRVTFVRHAQVAWILAYVAEKAATPK
jgi:exopolyphosphatase/pppGpp-phosphohydrolase